MQSALDAGGNVSLGAGNDLTLRASSVDALGNVAIAAAGDTRIEAAQDEDYLYTFTRRGGGGLSSRRSTTVEETTIANVGSSISGGGNVTINALIGENGIGLIDSGGVSIVGSDIRADNQLVINAGDGITLDAGSEQADRFKHVKKSGFLKKSNATNIDELQTTIGTELSGGDNVALISGGDTNVLASAIASDANITVSAGRDGSGDVNIVNRVNTQRSASFFESSRIGLSFGDGGVSFASSESNANDVTQVTNAASSLSALGNVGLSGDNVAVIGSNIGAVGNVGIQASEHITIGAGTGTSTASASASQESIGIGFSADSNSVGVFAGLTATSTDQQTTTQEVFGSSIAAGDDVVLRAGRDIDQIGSSVSAGNDAFYVADGDINVVSAIGQVDQQGSSSHETAGVGVSVDHGLGKAIDSAKQLGDAATSGGGAAGVVSTVSGAMATADAISQVLDGPTLNAHVGVKSTETNTQSRQEVAIVSSVNTGGSATFVAGANGGDEGDATFEGTAFNIGEDLNVSATDVTFGVTQTQSSSSSTTEQSSTGVAASISANKDSASISAGFEASGSDAQQDSQGSQSTVVIGQIGGAVNVAASNDATFTGTQLQSGDDFNLDVGNHLTVESATNTNAFTSEEDSWNGGVGVAATVGQGGPSAGVYVSAGIGQSDLDSQSTSQINADLNAGGDFNASVGGDAAFTGANVHADKAVNLDIDGDLLVASVQDTGTVDGERFNVGGKVVVGPSGVSGSVSAGVGETEGDTAWVAQQTTLTGGEQVAINVDGHTQLDGALIAQIDGDGSSGMDGGNLSLTTDTFGISDIEDSDTYTSSDIGVNAGFAFGGDEEGEGSEGGGSDGPDPLSASQGEISSWGVQGGYTDTDREQTNFATIGQGTVTVTSDDAASQQAVEEVNRDIGTAQVVTKDESTEVDLYVTDTGLDAITNPADTVEQWKTDIENYGASVEETLKGGKRVLDTTGKAIGSIANGEGLAGVKNDLVNDTLMWQLGEYRPDTFQALVNAEQAGPKAFEAALQVAANDLASLTGQDPAQVLVALTEEYQELTGVTASGAAHQDSNTVAVLLGDPDSGGTSVSDSTDVVRTLGEELAHVGSCGSDEACANQQGNDLADAFGEELDRQGITDTQDSQADAEYVAGNGQAGGLLDSNTDALAQIPVDQVDYRHLSDSEFQYLKTQARHYAEENNIDVAEAERLMLRGSLYEADDQAQDAYDSYTDEGQRAEYAAAYAYLKGKAEDDGVTFTNTAGEEQLAFTSTDEQRADSSQHITEVYDQEDYREALRISAEEKGTTAALTEYFRETAGEIAGGVIGTGEGIANIVTGTLELFDPETYEQLSDNAQAFYDLYQEDPEKAQAILASLPEEVATQVMETYDTYTKVGEYYDDIGQDYDEQEHLASGATSTVVETGVPFVAAVRVARLLNQVGDLIGKGAKVADGDGAPSGLDLESEGNPNRFDDTALEGQRRQQELLDSNQGYNVSGARDEVSYPDGTLGNPNPVDGPDSGFTFLTDRKAFEDVLGELPENGSTVKVSRTQLNQLEDSLGLEPGSLDSGSVLRRIDNVDNLSPASPLDGNDYFRGPGKHLPGAGPEIVVNPAQTRVNNSNIGESWTIEVID